MNEKGFFLREARWMVFFSLCPILLGLAAAFIAPRLFMGLCRNTVAEVIPSPDGSHKAVAFDRSCGATTDFSTRISVLRMDSALPDDGGNIFVADSDHGKAATGKWGGPRVGVSWDGGAHLRVTYASKSRIFKQESAAKEIAVTYAEDETRGDSRPSQGSPESASQ